MNTIQLVKYLCKETIETYKNDIPDEALIAIGRAMLEAYQEDEDEDD